MSDLQELLSTLGRQVLSTLGPSMSAGPCSEEGIAHGWVRPEQGPGIAVSADAPLACALASAMFGQEVTQIEAPEVLEVLGELANIVAGNARGFLDMRGDLGRPSSDLGPLAEPVLVEAAVPTPAGALRIATLAE